MPGLLHWALAVLFVLAAGATAFWVFLYARDAMAGGEPLVAGRFDATASLRLTALHLTALALTSGGLLFGHYRRADHYGSPFELFFRVVFGFSCAVALICLLPSLTRTAP